MGRTCIGVCTLHQSTPVHNSLRYKLGHKRCTFCNVFFLIDNVRCPCCKAVLRTKPRRKTKTIL